MRIPLAAGFLASLALIGQAPCDCIDKGDLKERLKMANAAIKAYGKELPGMGLLPCTAANRAALQAKVDAAVRAAQTPGRVPPAAGGATSNNCDIVVKAPTRCLEEAIRAHEKIHQDACRATWEQHQKAILMGKGSERFEALGLNLAAYMVEEVTGYQAEIQFISRELARLERDCKPKPPPRHAYTTARGIDLTGDPQPPAGQGGPKPIAAPPMPKPKPLPNPPPIQ